MKWKSIPGYRWYKISELDMMHHGRSKNQFGPPVFSNAEVLSIRQQFQARKVSKKDLATELGVNYWTLRDMLNGKSYAWVK